MVSLSLQELEEFDPDASSSAAERRFLCPLCGNGKPKDSAHRSLCVNAKSGAWLCHRCSEKGKLSEWKDEKPTDFRESRRRKLRNAFALDELSSSVSAHADTIQIKGENENPLLEVSACADTPGSTLAWRSSLKSLHPLQGTPGEAYLQSRGIAAEIAHSSGVRFSPSWFGRPATIFPIRGSEGILVAAQGRYVGEGRGPKVRTAGEKKAGVFVTAGFWQYVQRGAPLIICEAPIDALSFALCGFPAMALCGKDGWPDWLPIKCAFKSVALAFDADDAGDAGAEKLSQVLVALGAKPFRLRPEGSKDWNEILSKSGYVVLHEWLVTHLLG